MGNSAVAVSADADNGTSQPDKGVKNQRVDASLSRDDMFAILSNHRRRFLLHCLQQNGGKSELGEISVQVAAWENEIEVESVSSNQRKRVYTSLQQFHLPKLDDQHVVDFEERAGEVKLTDAADNLDIYLEVIDKHDMPWSYYYMGLTGVGIALVTLSYAGMPVLAGISSWSWIAFILASFAVTSVAHTYFLRKMRLGSDGDPPEVRER